MAVVPEDTYLQEAAIIENKCNIKTLIEELSLICMPSTLWGVHKDVNQKFLAFSILKITEDDFIKTTKSIVLRETENNTLKILVFMNNKKVEIPYVSTSVCNVNDLNNLLIAIDAVKFCKYYLLNNNEERCLIFNLPLMDVCSRCFNRSAIIDDLKTNLNIETEDVNNINQLRDISFNKSQQNFTNNNKCMLCNKLFNAEENLAKHYKDHNILKNDDDRFECTVCLNSFNNITAILEHYKQYHSSVKFINCSVCYKKFTTIQRLQNHIRNHTGYETFTCSHCNKDFISKQRLAKHICTKSFNLSKMRICIICNTKYATNHLLRQHQREHQIHAPDKCNKCNKNFDENLSANQVVEHKLQCKKRRLKYPCKMCDKKFSCATQRLCHIKRLHPLYI